MRKSLGACLTVVFTVATLFPAIAQTTPPGQTVNVTPNQQTTQATAVSNPSGQNISQQNNFYDPGQNSFGPGVACTGPYIASSVFKTDSSNPGSVGTGGYSNVGGTIGLVVPINGASNKKCQEFTNEIVMQRQLDTCLSLAKQGFAFDPKVYPKEAARCAGIMYTGHPIGAAGNVQNSVSPPTPPTVITVPANPNQPNNLPLLKSNPIPHAAADLDAVPVPEIAVATPAPYLSKMTELCQRISAERKKHLLAVVRGNGENRHAALEQLHAACISDSEIVAQI